MRKRALLAVLAGGALAIVTAAYALVRLLLRGAFEVRPFERSYDVEVVDVAEGRITLRAKRGAPPALFDGASTYGLEWDGGYGRVGRLIEREDGAVVREFAPISGSPAPGMLVRFDSFAFPLDPRTAHGMHFEEVHVPGELSPLPAWHIPGVSETWLIFVHGKGAWRGEALRLLPVARDLGMPALSITYRGDDQVLTDPSGRYGYGLHEWRDLEAAVRFALEHGARCVVPVGYSMGGAIVLNFLLRSALRRYVAGAILDSPMLDLRATVEHQAALAGHPRLATGLMVRAARFAGVRWRDFDFIQHADELDTPILLLHGDADPDVPVATSDRFAAARPDIVEYVRVPGAGHVLSWNAGLEEYEAHVRAFLKRVAGCEPPPGECSPPTP
ncbi:MAG: prolyl oligopeptidase family serine peptidase [Dehalococcoidia bacterium]|nr:prolyl oligopeptidase family serine peptidase [Dehalococcoidia bacterium]